MSGPNTGSVRGTMARGGIYVLIRRVIANALRIGAIAVLARKLTAPEFGIVALAQMAVGLLTVFGSGGVLTYIVCDRDPDWETRVNPAFWLNVFLTLGSCAFVLAFVPFVVRVYDQPLVRDLMFVLLGDYFIDQLRLVPDALLQRRLRFRVQAVRDTARDFFTAGCAIAMALAGWGVWSLVLPNLICAPFEVLFTAWAARFRPRLALGRAEWPRIFRFTRSVIGEQLLTFLGNEADTAVVGKVMGSAALGVYNLAYQLANLIGKNVSAVLSMVSMPALAAAYERKTALGPPYRSMIRVLALMTTPLLLGMFVLSNELVMLVYGPRWMGAVLLLRIFIVFTVVRSVTSPSGPIFSVVGRPDLSLKIVLWFLLVYIPMLVITSQWGVVELAVGVAASRVIVGMVSLYMSLDLIGESKRRVTNELLGPLAAGLLMAIASWLVNEGLIRMGQPIPLRIIAVSAFGFGAYWVLIRSLAPRALEETLVLIRSVIARRRRTPTPERT